MESIITIIVIAIIALVSLTFFLGVWGALLSSVLAGLIAGWVGQGLRGFGSPTGNVPSSTDWPMFFEHFLLWFIIGLLSFPVLLMIKLSITKQAFPNHFLAIWLTFAVAVSIYKIGYNIYIESKKISLHVDVGYNGDAKIAWDGISVVLKSDSQTKSASFNSSGSSREPNKFGYTKFLSASITMYFVPESIIFTYDNYQPVEFDLSRQVEEIRLFIDKDKTVKLFIDGSAHSESTTLIKQ